MEVGLVKKINIDEEMQQAYLDYAMSVIVARALPDARDGLKPVHRRILYAMYDMGLRPDTPYKKSARIVGEVLGKYHPHGDMAVYDAMARMAQDFSMRYLLVDGQGNFGSVDGDPPAAMRYTEARLQSAALQMLADIGKNTVDFTDNFDGTLTEPDVLPAAVPNLLVNGATGIAVGMSTSIPPHNLNEVVDALIYMLDNWEKLEDLGMEDLMRFVQGPDFPTGGLIIQEANDEGLINAYGSGRGRVTVQARAHLEEMERGRNRIIVTELPYMTNKSSLIERIAELVREERLEGIVDLRDESDRQGMRIVIELTKTADPEAVLRDLYKHTPMQSTFSFIMLALVDGEPRLLSLKQVLRVYIEHRLTIIKRRSQFDLEKARQREHILAGLRVALQNLDEIIDLIRKSPDADVARERLMKRFKLSQIQAQAILDMPLRRLAALERKKIELEYKEVLALIKDLESLLHSPKRMRQVVAEELLAVKAAYGDRRRTHIIRLKEGERKMSLLTAGELTPDKTIWVSVTSEGLIGRSHDNRVPQLGGKDTPAWLVQASTREILYLVSEQGETAAVAVHALPEVEKPSEGVPLYKGSALLEGMQLATIFKLPPKERQSSRNGNGGQGEQNGKAPADGKGPSAEKAAGNGTLSPEEERYIVTVTRQGMVKKSAASELPGPSAGTFTLARVNEGDRLGWARLSNGKNEVLLVTANGMAIRFNEDEVRPMGLVAAGVMGLKLQAGDEVAGMELLPQPGEVFLLASDGSAKRVPANDFPAQGRYGQGVNAWKLAKGVRVVGAGAGKASAYAIVHLANQEPISIHLNEAPVGNRAARGQVVKTLKNAAAALPGGAITGFIIPYGETDAPDDGSKAGRARGKKDEGPGGSRGGTSKDGGAAPSTGKSAKAAPPKGVGVKKTAPKRTAAQEPTPARRGAAKTAEPQAKPAETKAKKSAAAAPTPGRAAPAGKAGTKAPAKNAGAPVKNTGAPAGKAAQKSATTKEAPKAAAKAPAPKTTAKAPQKSVAPQSPAATPAAKPGKSPSKTGPAAPGAAPTPPATKSGGSSGGSSRNKAPASQPAEPPPIPQNKPRAKKGS